MSLPSKVKSQIDARTLAAYDAAPARYADDWLAQPSPAEFHRTVEKYFRPGTCVADIGCGSGRDVDWLCRQGFAAEGFDASEGLLSEARQRFPAYKFTHALLPDLAEISDASFDQVVCETVIQHLPHASVAPALASLLRILRPGGVLQLSWRLPDDSGTRQADGRLYTSLEFREVEAALRGAEILESAEFASSSSGKKIRQLVARKA